MRVWGRVMLYCKVINWTLLVVNSLSVVKIGCGCKESCYAVVSFERAAEILAIPNERPSAVLFKVKGFGVHGFNL